MIQNKHHSVNRMSLRRKSNGIQSTFDTNKNKNLKGKNMPISDDLSRREISSNSLRINESEKKSNSNL